MPLTTVLDLLTQALVGIRVHRMAAPLPPEMAEHALDTLNRLLDAWSVEGRPVIRWASAQTPLTGALSYTIGPGGVLNTPLPFTLKDGYSRVGDNDYPYTVIGQATYNQIGLKTEGGYAPQVVWYERSTPLGRVYPWPLGSAGTLYVFYDEPLGPLALNNVLTYPRGYADALVYALGRREASAYGQTLDALYLEEARKAEANLRKRLYQPVMAAVPGLGTHRGRDMYWIYRGE
jgi:hypothetical protein